MKPLNEQTVTKGDLKALESRLKSNSVSKSEFKREVAKLATKEELQREVAKLVTKEEFKREIAKLATKEELEIVRRRLDEVASQGALHVIDIQELKQNIVSMNTKLDVVLQAIDGLAGKVESYKTEQAAVLHSLSRHDRRLDDHERRIEKLEVRSELS